MASRIEPAMILAAMLSLVVSVPTTLAQTGVVATNRAAEDARKRGDSAFEKKHTPRRCGGSRRPTDWVMPRP